MTLDDLMARFKDAVNIRHVAEDTVLFHRGDRPRHIFGVVEGEAVLRRFTAEGAEIVVHRARAGTLFAEAALFSERYHCDAIAKGGSSIAAFAKADMVRLLADDGRFATAFCHTLASQVQGLRSSLEVRAIRNAEDRIVAALSLRLAEGRRELELAGTWKQFAQDIGLTHEALYRALGRLEDAGRISRDGQTVRLSR